MTTPIRVTTPPDTRPPFLGLRLWWYTWKWFPTWQPARAADDPTAATLRWRAFNADQPAVCGCGRPGTVRVTDPRGGFAGSVAPYWWRCEEHADVPINAKFVNGRRATREECSSWASSIKTGIISDCDCGTHVGEVRQ
jgi:hypothetical protein